jgi:hypothetical protein
MYDIGKKIKQTLKKAGIDYSKISIITSPLREARGTKQVKGVTEHQYHIVIFHAPGRLSRKIIEALEYLEFDNFVLTKPEYTASETSTKYVHETQYRVELKKGISAVIDFEEPEVIEKKAEPVEEAEVEETLESKVDVPDAQEEKKEKKVRKMNKGGKQWQK